MQPKLHQQRIKIIEGFSKLGFMGVMPFCNVCKHVDGTLSDVDLAGYYQGSSINAELNSRLLAILDFLKHE